MQENWANVVELVHNGYTIKNYEVVNRCVYNFYVITLVGELWTYIMLHWPTSS